MYCFYAWFKKGGSETIKLFSYNSLCRCFKAHTILTSIMICLWFAGCGGDSFHQSAEKSPSSGCFFKRDFGESSLLKLRNFKTSIRICLCFASCGGDSFHQIAKKSPSSGCFFELVFGEWALMMQRRFRNDKGIAYGFLLKKIKQRAINYKIKFCNQTPLSI